MQARSISLAFKLIKQKINKLECRMAEWLPLQTATHGVLGSIPTNGEALFWRNKSHEQYIVCHFELN